MVARRGLLRKYYSVSVMTKLRAQIKDIRARITVHHLLSSSPPPSSHAPFYLSYGPSLPPYRTYIAACSHKL